MFKDIQEKNIREGHYYFADTILKQFWYHFINYECTHHNLCTQIESLYKLVSVMKGNLFVSYENLKGGACMILCQVCLSFYLTFRQ